MRFEWSEGAESSHFRIKGQETSLNCSVEDELEEDTLDFRGLLTCGLGTRRLEGVRRVVLRYLGVKV